MVYKQTRHKIQIALIIIFIFITFVAGANWMMWSVIPFSLIFLYISGKIPNYPHSLMFP